MKAQSDRPGLQGRSAQGELRRRPATAVMLARHLRQASQAGADPPAPVPPATGAPERIFAAAFMRAAQSAFNLSVRPINVGIGRASPAELAELLPERALVLLVEDEGGSLGVAGVCPLMLASLIEMQSLGRVGDRAPRERRPTRTDAAICADLVNATLASLSRELGVIPGLSQISDYRFASQVEGAESLNLLLEEGAYHRFDLRARVGEASQREGRFLAFLPARDSGPARPARPGVVNLTGGQGDRGNTGNRRISAQDIPVTIYAVLGRRQMSLRDIRALRPGSELPMPPGVMTSAWLETSTGSVVARGKFGAFHGHRAIRVQSDAASRPGGGDRAPEPSLQTGNDLRDPNATEDEAGATGNVFAEPDEEATAEETPAMLTEPPLEDASLPDQFRIADGDPDFPSGKVGELQADLRQMPD